MGDILITDDERDIRELISDILKDEGFTTRLAANADQCMAEISKDKPALMILDIWLKDSHMDGIDILKSVKRDHPEIPIVIISGHGNIEIAVAAIKQGAYDFIEKPFNIDQLMVVIRRAMETSRLRRENQELKRGDAPSAEMLGDSAAFRSLKSQLDKVTRSNGRVMLTGAPGSGKEIAARYIHAQSNRSDAPFVTVASAAIEPERMEGADRDVGGEPAAVLTRQQLPGPFTHFARGPVRERDRDDPLRGRVRRRHRGRRHHRSRSGIRECRPRSQDRHPWR